MMIMSKGLSQKINECSEKYSSCLFDDFKRSLLQPVKKVIYQRNFTMLISCQEFFQNMLLWIFTIFSKTSNGKTVSGLLNKIEVNCSARFPMLLLPPLLQSFKMSLENGSMVQKQFCTQGQVQNTIPLRIQVFCIGMVSLREESLYVYLVTLQ